MGNINALKSIKITSVIQIVYCVYLLVNVLLLIIGTGIGPVCLANIGLALFYFVTLKSIIIMPICLIVNLVFFLDGRKDSEQKKILGKRWLWIFVYPVIEIALFIINCLPFIRIPLF